MNHKLPKLTVKSLRSQKALVRVIHLRRIITDISGLKEVTKPVYAHVAKGAFADLKPISINIELPKKVSQMGGETKIEVDLANGNHYEANAICSARDSYNKRRGVAISLANIAKQMKDNKEEVLSVLN